jgi:hypothetical protein
MSCQCPSCQASDKETMEKLGKLGAWLVRRAAEGRNASTTSTMLKRKLIKLQIITTEEST